MKTIALLLLTTSLAQAQPVRPQNNTFQIPDPPMPTKANTRQAVKPFTVTAVKPPSNPPLLPVRPGPNFPTGPRPLIGPVPRLVTGPPRFNYILKYDDGTINGLVLVGIIGLQSVQSNSVVAIQSSLDWGRHTPPSWILVSQRQWNQPVDYWDTAFQARSGEREFYRVVVSPPGVSSIGTNGVTIAWVAPWGPVTTFWTKITNSSGTVYTVTRRPAPPPSTAFPPWFPPMLGETNSATLMLNALTPPRWNDTGVAYVVLH